jgi:hypothetical protein
MGAPYSSLFSEIFLQHIELAKTVHILLQYHNVDYFRYVYDILIVYKQNLTNTLSPCLFQQADTHFEIHY